MDLEYRFRDFLHGRDLVTRRDDAWQRDYDAFLRWRIFQACLFEMEQARFNMTSEGGIALDEEQARWLVGSYG